MGHGCERATFIEASKTVNVSRSGVRLSGLPTKLTVGDVIGLKCNGKKYRFRVVWLGTTGGPEAGNVGLQSLEAGEWIWKDLKLPADDIEIYSRPPESELRLLNRVRCFLSAEVICHGTGPKTLAFVRDLSLGGCYIALTFPLPVELNVSIAIQVNEQKKIWVDGIVISSHEATGMGVKFVSISRPILDALDRCVKELTEPPEPLRIWLPD